MIVSDQDEMDRASKEGWYDTPDLALAGYEDTQKSMADVAAMRHFADQAHERRGAVRSEDWQMTHA
jgi:hypothetical protein